jgi:cytochrome c oxidase subunit 2
MTIFFNTLFPSATLCDAPEPWQFGFQDPATPAAEGMIAFHDYLMLFLIVIGVLVCWFFIKLFTNFNEKANTTPEIFTHSSVLEIVWTILPAVILLFIAAPSFALLYSLDESIDPDMTLKIVGHQWYWSYEYSDPIDQYEGSEESIMFDSYLIPEADLALGAFRLLEVDNRVILPVGKHIRLLITAADVIHSWAVPSFAVKVDACPGRISEASLFIKREGVFYGQCSEICGINHGFMPIVIEAKSPEFFSTWYSNEKAGS